MRLRQGWAHDPGPEGSSKPKLPRLFGGELTVGDNERGQHLGIRKEAVPPVQIVVATHRSRRRAHPEVVRKQLLDCPAHQLPDRPVRQFGVHLPSASIDTDKGLERQIHIVPIAPPSVRPSLAKSGERP